jgi:hypothetical protein
LEASGTWIELPEEVRLRFRGKLSGLFGVTGDEAAYDSLARDKQEALMLLSQRLVELALWQSVTRIVNVYGQGGVGLNFTADAECETLLLGRKDFTSLLARRDNPDAFFENARTRASLHFLYSDRAETGRDWHVHFDFYGPMGSLLSAVQHLNYERFGKFRPDWRMIKSRFRSPTVRQGVDLCSINSHSV